MTDLKTPMLDKMREVQETSQVIGEFLEWLGHEGLQVGSYGPVEYPNEPCGGPDFFTDCKDGRLSAGTASERECHVCKGTGRVTITRSAEFRPIASIEAILAQYFGIDLNQAEVERRAILDSL